MCLAIPGKIIEITSQDPIMRTGNVSFGGIIKQINLAYVPDANEDDYVIVHAGFAISQLNEDEAKLVLDELESLEEDNPSA
jgi:hydrogenase expression/formation protein HypC